MTNFKRGDIILVHFPFTDLSSTKQRPALVVSSDALNAASEDVLAGKGVKPCLCVKVK
jgi:mRNA interferase MazF